jgi:hypothetical protein
LVVESHFLKEAEMSEGKAITLSLVEWQKRMIRDYMKSAASIEEIGKVTISVIDKRQWVMYRQPVPADAVKGAWNLYLTDAQINKVAAMLGADIKISALRISPEMVKSGAIVFG